MTKKRQPLAILQPTGNAEPEPAHTKAVGVGLRESEVIELDRIVTSEGITRNALLRIAVHRLITDYNAGKLNLAQYLEDKRVRKLKF